MHMRFYYSMQLLIVQLLLSVLETKAKAEMADESVTESTEIEKPRSRGRPTKHATPHLTEDNELKVIVEGLSTLKRTPTTTSSGLNPTCCVVVPHRLLLTWRKQVLSTNEASYISLLNESIVNHMICVSPSCTRLEQRFVKRAGEVHTKTSVSGRARQQMIEKSTTFTIYEGEVVDCLQLAEEVETLAEEVETLSHEVECWKQELIEAEEDIQALREEVAQLYCERDNEKCWPEYNTSKKVDEVSPRQKRRKLNQFRSFAEKALWFAESFGLTPQSLTLSSESDEQYTLQLGTDNSRSSTDTKATESAITTASIHETLYLLEKFGVSDEFYHELSMHHPSLARSYKVKELRKELTSEIEVIRLPNPFDGAYRPFLPMLSTVFEYQVWHIVYTIDVMYR